MNRATIAVAMSGGLDSSMVAALLCERGHAVLGLTMCTWREGAVAGNDPHVGDANARDARTVCDFLGIAHHVVDLRADFEREVVKRFCAEYARGRTPNPCVCCNRKLKFGLLLDHARSLGCETVATGHYSRILRVGDGYHLLCGMDASKDQSYFLYMLRQQQLARLAFPLGEFRKVDLRDRARAMGLPVAQKPESQDVCFTRDGDYRRFLKARCPEVVRPGPIMDTRGCLLGTHRGLPFYTVGQRGGLGISASEPLYVMRLDPARNALIVGPAHELGSSALLASEMSYVSGEPLLPGVRVEAKIRYRARPAAARTWMVAPRSAQIVFEQSLRDITPGQAVVLYDGDRVLGGGTIDRALPLGELSA